MLILCIYDTALIRCVYHDRAGASPHLLLYYYYDTACLNPPGIYRSRGSTTAPSGTTTHTRFAHKILHYIIIIICNVVSTRQRLFRIKTVCFLFFHAVFQLHKRLLLRNVTTPADSSWFDFFHYYYLFSYCS